MPYKTGTWGKQAQLRFKRRVENGEFTTSDIKLKNKRDYINRVDHPINEQISLRNIKANALGQTGEREAEIILGIKRNPRRSKTDFNWNGKTIDVKTSKYYKEGYWKFNLCKQKGLCDLFLVICKDYNSVTINIFLIPDKDLTRNSLIITRNKLSKFSKYLFNEGQNVRS